MTYGTDTRDGDDREDSVSEDERGAAARWAEEGVTVSGFGAGGEVAFVGEVVAYVDAPMVKVKNRHGVVAWWRADWCREGVAE